MFNTMRKNTLAAAGFAALLLTGACASNRNATDTTDSSDTIQNVTQSSSVTPAPGPALVDHDGNIYSSSAAGGVGNSSSVGTNTNVNLVPQKSTVSVTESTTQPTGVTVTEVTNSPLNTSTTVTTEQPVTTTTETTTVTTAPMTSSTQETTTETPTRKRLRKD